MKSRIAITAAMVALTYFGSITLGVTSSHNKRAIAVTSKRAELLPPISVTAFVPPISSIPQPVVIDTVTTYERYEWSKVNQCENGGSWYPQGSAYPDGLGIDATNWYAWGGGNDLFPDAQIMVAEQGEDDAGTPGYVPDQDGCAAW